MNKKSCKVVLMFESVDKILQCDHSNGTSLPLKKVVSDSLGLVDFAIRPVIFVLNLPGGR